MSENIWADIILSITDKNPYCRKLLYELYHQQDEFVERRFYELSFALYGRFFTEKLSPLHLVEYFQAMQSIFGDHALLRQNPDIKMILELGLSLANFSQYSEENFQLTNTLLQINYHIARWHNKSHICKYCGHKLELLTQPLDVTQKLKKR